jgi:hypothetical protein
LVLCERRRFEFPLAIVPALSIAVALVNLLAVSTARFFALRLTFAIEVLFLLMSPLVTRLPLARRATIALGAALALRSVLAVPAAPAISVLFVAVLAAAAATASPLPTAPFAFGGRVGLVPPARRTALVALALPPARDGFR